jgi:hypothetical protein
MDATKGNGLTTPHSQPAKTLSKHTADSATIDQHSKAESNLIERLVLARHTVHQGRDGDYIVSKYGLSRYCTDLAELQTFAIKLGVCHE